MFEVEDWVEELIERIMNTYGCNRKQAINLIKENLY
jgi:hypothetical protein